MQHFHIYKWINESILSQDMNHPFVLQEGLVVAAVLNGLVVSAVAVESACARAVDVKIFFRIQYACLVLLKHMQNIAGTGT